MLFCKNKEELTEYLPKEKPAYSNRKLDPYNDVIKIDSKDNDYYFADKLISLIKEDGNHEVGTHTFSHYYCNEKGQNIEQFDADLKAATEVAKKNDIILRSIIFPRNQVKAQYLKICFKNGIDVFRGNDEGGFYNSGTSPFYIIRNKIIRFLDTYIPLTGYNTFEISINSEIIDAKASRFLRPYSRKLRFLEALKLSRIKKSMTHAAKNKLVYHLWWHPHNFGSYTEENFYNLENILIHYNKLKIKYNMESKKMSDFSNL
jgi:hypothetical protein